MRLSVVSLFSGCGGFDLGFKWAGYDIKWANDISKDAYKTYRNNISDKIELGDLNSIGIENIPSCDAIIGGPPCQPFSLVGKRDSNDNRHDLVYLFARAIKEVRPTIFIMENVVGLKSSIDQHGERIFPKLIQEMSSHGYKIDWAVLNAANYGVPQLRRRLFIVGNREPVKIEFPEFTNGPNKNILGFNIEPFVTAREALGDLPSPPSEIDSVKYDKEPITDFQMWARKNNENVVTNHQLPHMSELDKVIISYVPPGGNYMNVPPSVPSRRIQKFKETGGRTTTYGRLDPDKPSYTINTHFNRRNVGCNIHYKEDRLITIREGLRLQSFPDHFRLPPNLSKRGQYSLVGNAVPPLLAYALASKLKELF